MRLSDMKIGDSFEIIEIKEDKMRDMAVRLGICEGRKFNLVALVPKGPCIIQNLATNIVVGRQMAEMIVVRRR